MGYVAESPPRPGESSEDYARRCIDWHLSYGRELGWQYVVAALGIPVLGLLIALMVG